MPHHTYQNVVVFKAQKIISVGKDVEKRELLCVVGERANGVLWEKNMVFPLKKET